MTKFNRRLPPISIQKGLPFIALIVIVITVALTGWLGYRNSQAIVLDMVTELNNEIADRIYQHTADYLRDTRRFLEANQSSTISNNIDLTNFTQLQQVFWRQIQSTEASSVYYGNEAGDYIGVGRRLDGQLVFQTRNAETAPERLTYLLDSFGRKTELIARQEYDPRLAPLVYCRHGNAVSNMESYLPICRSTNIRINSRYPDI